MRTPNRIMRRQLLLSVPVLLLDSSEVRAAADDLVVIVNRASDVKTLSRAELEAIFTTRRRYWSGSTKIVACNLPAKTQERMRFDRAILGFGPEQVGRYWIDRKVRGGAPPPRTVPDARTSLGLVSNTADAIGYVPRSIVTGEVRVIAQVSNGQLVAARRHIGFDLGDDL